MYKYHFITSFRNKTKAALYGLNWSISNNKPVIFQVQEFFYGNVYSIYYVECIETPTIGTAVGGIGGIGRIGG